MSTSGNLSQIPTMGKPLQKIQNEGATVLDWVPVAQAPWQKTIPLLMLVFGVVRKTPNKREVGMEFTNALSNWDPGSGVGGFFATRWTRHHQRGVRKNGAQRQHEDAGDDALTNRKVETRTKTCGHLVFNFAPYPTQQPSC